jgi:hypothetical protein
MKKEVLYMFVIAGLQLLVFLIVALCLLFKAFPAENEKILYLIIGALIGTLDNVKGLVNTIKDYFYGSSVKNEKPVI